LKTKAYIPSIYSPLPGGIGLVKPPGKISGGKSFLASKTGIRIRNVHLKAATSSIIIIFYIEYNILNYIYIIIYQVPPETYPPTSVATFQGQ